MKKIIIGSIVISTCVMYACTKENSLPDRFTPIPATNTAIKFLEMSPDAPPINFFLNGAKATANTPTGTNAATGLSFPSFYPNTVGYATYASGAIKVEAKVPDSSTVMPGATVFTDNKTFTAGKFYTYVLLDSLSKLSTIMVEDDPSVPDPTKAYFRIANFIPNSPVKIEVLKSNGVLFQSYSSVAAKTISNFDTLGVAGSQTYNIYLKNPTTNVNLDSIKSFAPTATKKYTIYARGVFGQSGSTNTRRPIITSYTNF